MIYETPGVAELPVHVTFVPSIDDLVLASRETVRAGRRRQWGEKALPIILGIIIVVQVAQHGIAALYGSAVYLVVALLILLAVTLGAPLFIRWGIVRQRRQNPHFEGPVTYTFTADGVHLQTPLGASDMPWTSFVRARETREQILLFFARRAAYFVPRRALREDEERRLKALIGARLGPLAELTNESNTR